MTDWQFLFGLEVLGFIGVLNEAIKNIRDLEKSLTLNLHFMVPDEIRSEIMDLLEESMLDHEDEGFSK